jgi:urease accessory protein UreF
MTAEASLAFLLDLPRTTALGDLGSAAFLADIVSMRHETR